MKEMKASYPVNLDEMELLGYINIVGDSRWVFYLMKVYKDEKKYYSKIYISDINSRFTDYSQYLDDKIYEYYSLSEVMKHAYSISACYKDSIVIWPVETLNRFREKYGTIRADKLANRAMDPDFIRDVHVISIFESDFQLDKKDVWC